MESKSMSYLSFVNIAKCISKNYKKDIDTNNSMHTYYMYTYMYIFDGFFRFVSATAYKSSSAS